MKRIIVFLLAASLMLALCAATVGAKEGHALDLVIGTEGEGEEISAQKGCHDIRHGADDLGAGIHAVKH